MICNYLIKFVLDCAIINILLVTEYNRDVSPEELMMVYPNNLVAV